MYMLSPENTPTPPILAVSHYYLPNNGRYKSVILGFIYCGLVKWGSGLCAPVLNKKKRAGGNTRGGYI